MRQFSENFYIGEHLVFGHIGQLLIILGFVSAIFLFVLGIHHFLNSNKKNEDYKLIQYFLFAHGFSVAGIVLLLIFLFKGQYFEYHYIWRHSSSELPWYYILSAMWEGQEGSFILWIFWHMILAMITWRQKSEQKTGVLAIIMLVQALLFTMILGVDVFGKLIGTNPFILLRDELSIPILSNPNYLTLIKDGNGLNILLQNYWMVIHPPVLFLGFAATTIPFAYIASSLVKRDFLSWTKEVNSWVLFALTTLGTGILMGGRWAYEALSFGGFWAWDPVENASLVPWLFTVAGLHTLLVYKATKHSLKATYILLTLAFGFVLYSTFLTRSGILGDSSVHSFTDLGMTGQLVIFIGLLLLPVFLMLAFHWSQIPDIKDEEKSSSKEFWIFMGALFIVVSSLQISFTTSIPLWNKLFDLKLAPPINANDHYNSIQIWFAIVVCILMGLGLWLNYRQTKVNANFVKTILPAFGLSIIITALHLWLSNVSFFQKYEFLVKDYKLSLHFISSYFLLFFSAIYLILLSVQYITTQLKNADKLYWGGSIAHIGFGILILGALISQYQKKAISMNMAGIDLGKEFNMEEQSSNTLLMRGKKETMGDYWVTYKGKSEIKKGEQYAILFQNKKNLSDSFNIAPEAKIIKEGMNNRLNPEPGIYHFFGKDIFAHVSCPVPDFSQSNSQSKDYKLKLKDTIFTGSRYILFSNAASSIDEKKNTLIVNATLLLGDWERIKDTIVIPFTLHTQSGSFENPMISSKDGGLKIQITNISPETKEFQFLIEDKVSSDWIILKVLEFPYIQILWLGCIIMIIGSIMSMLYRRKKSIDI